MNLKSLGYRSEQIFTSFDGELQDRGPYQVVRTPTNPGYYWGNLLIFDRAPVRSDFLNWVKTFKSEFPGPEIRHVTLAWDVPDVGDVSQFLENGYEFQAQAVLAAKQVRRPLRFSSDLEVRPISGREEWNSLIQLQTDSVADSETSAMPRTDWQRFYESQRPRYQKMIEAGVGEWYGGFLERRLVCGLGIFQREGLGRFQIVATHPDFRRRGFAGTLVFRAAEHAMKKFSITELVICADPDYHAIGIYEQVGFERRGLEYGVYWWKRDESR